MGLARSRLPCIASEPEGDARDVDADDAAGAAGEDDDGDAVAVALERGLARAREARSMMSRGNEINGKATTGGTCVGSSDSGAVEMVLVQVRSDAVARAGERAARERLEARGTEARLARDETEAPTSSRRRIATDGLARERFAVSLFAKRAGEGETEGRWRLLGRVACEPSAARDGALAPLFREEALRRPSVGESLRCAPKWIVPSWCDATKTTFHLVLEKLKDGADEPSVGATPEDDARANDRDALSESKGTHYGDAKFTLMDMCGRGCDRSVVLECRDRPQANAPRTASVGRTRAECVLVLTPPERSRAWCSTKEKRSKGDVSRKREFTPADALSFEALFNCVEDALTDENAVLSVERHRLQRERAKQTLEAKPLSNSITDAYRTVAADDVPLGELPSVSARAPNRAQHGRSRVRRKHLDDRVARDYFSSYKL